MNRFIDFLSTIAAEVIILFALSFAAKIMMGFLHKISYVQSLAALTLIFIIAKIVRVAFCKWDKK